MNIRKTYLVTALGALCAALGYYLDSLNGKETAISLFLAAALASLRHAVAKLSPQPVTLDMTRFRGGGGSMPVLAALGLALGAVGLLPGCTGPDGARVPVSLSYTTRAGDHDVTAAYSSAKGIGVAVARDVSK